MIRYLTLALLILLSTQAFGAERPEGTCRGWVDKDKNGFCDRSEKEKGCRSEKCPASKHNPDAVKKQSESKSQGPRSPEGAKTSGAAGQSQPTAPNRSEAAQTNAPAALLPAEPSGVQSEGGCGCCAGACANCPLFARAQQQEPNAV